VGVNDSAIGTKVKDTYFEVNTTADIYENAATDPVIENTQHFGPGAVAIKGRNTTGAYIRTPLMGNSARTTGLYDWDGTNTNCFEFHIVDAGSKNLPIGVATGLRTFPTIAQSGDYGSFTANTIAGEAGTALGAKGGTGSPYDFDVTDPTGLSNRFVIAEPGNASYVDGTIFQTKAGLSVSAAVRPDDSGLKHKRFGATCATAASAGATCTSTFAWTTALADANYTPLCWGVAPTGSPILSLSTVQIAASVTVQVQAATASASSFAGVYCEAMHD